MKKSQLHNIRETGFKTPDGYFDSFESRLINKMNIQKEMDGIQNTGFTVPPHYFEQVADSIKEKIATEPKSKLRSITFYKNAGMISGIAAALLIMVAIITKSSNNLSINQIETASIENYLNDANLSTYDIASYLNEDDLELDHFVANSFSEESLENYLLNNASIEDLINDK